MSKNTPAHAKIVHNSLQKKKKKLEEDVCWNIPLMTQLVNGLNYTDRTDVTETHHTWTVYFKKLLYCCAY